MSQPGIIKFQMAKLLKNNQWRLPKNTLQDSKTGRIQGLSDHPTYPWLSCWSIVQLAYVMFQETQQQPKEDNDNQPNGSKHNEKLRDPRTHSPSASSTHGSMGMILQKAAVESSGDYSWLVGQGHPSEKYEFVNWDDDRHPILMGKCQKWQPNHQPDSLLAEGDITRARGQDGQDGQVDCGQIASPPSLAGHLGMQRGGLPGESVAALHELLDVDTIRAVASAGWRLKAGSLGPRGCQRVFLGKWW